MRIFRHISELTAAPGGTVAALGNFDGFHRGHQVVIGETGRIARDMGVPLTVVVTEPHPVRFFKPDLPPFRLTPFRERASLLETFGVDQLVVLPFDAELAGMAAQDFVLDVLVDGLNVLHVCVGYDYRFGKGRGGGVDVLGWMGEMEGFGLSVIDPVRIAVAPYERESYSSSLVRRALQNGQARIAADLLGHWWGLSGRVIRGDRRGRTIGFPTANIALGDTVIPRFGVYAVRVVMEDDGGRVCDGVANLGMRPTFDKADPLLEVHLFDFQGDLYETHLRVEFVDFLRSERKFDGLEALKTQIAADCTAARDRLAAPVNAREQLRRPRLDAYLEGGSKPF